MKLFNFLILSTLCTKLVCTESKYFKLVDYDRLPDGPVCLSQYSINSKIMENCKSIKLCALFCLEIKCLVFSYDSNIGLCIASVNAMDPLELSSPGCQTFQQNEPVFKSCLEIKYSRPTAISKIYDIKVENKTVKVWCDMATNGGGYTFFLNDPNLNNMTQSMIDSTFTNRSQFMLVLNRSTGVQNYGIVEQLDPYRDLRINIVLRTTSKNLDTVVYYPPLNENTLGPPYLFVALKNMAKASFYAIHGLKINGHAIEFGPSSIIRAQQMIFFQRNSPFSNRQFDSRYIVPGQKILNATDGVMNYRMPDVCFYAWEVLFYDVTYFETDGRPSVGSVLSASLGIK